MATYHSTLNYPRINQAIQIASLVLIMIVQVGNISNQLGISGLLCLDTRVKLKDDQGNHFGCTFLFLDSGFKLVNRFNSANEVQSDIAESILTYG